MPYLFAAAAVLLAALTVLVGRRVLSHIDDPSGDEADDAAAILIGDAA